MLTNIFNALIATFGIVQLLLPNTRLSKDYGSIVGHLMEIIPKGQCSS